MEQEAKRKHLKKQNFISAAILVSGTILSLLFFGPDRSRSQEVPSEQTQQKPSANVETMILGLEQNKTATLDKTATFVSTENAKVFAEYTGRVRQVKFEVGNYVKKGQVLAKFDQDDGQNAPKVALDAARRSLAIAMENLEQTKKLANETEELAKNARKIAQLQLEQAEELEEEIEDGGFQSDVAVRSLENAEDFEEQTQYQSELAINNAQLQVSQAREAVQSAQVQFDKTIVSSPISGLVTLKRIDDDQFLKVGDEVAQIVGTGTLEATISLTHSQIVRIRPNDEVVIEIGQERYFGQIESYSPIARSGNERYDVKIRSDQVLTDESNRSGRIFLKLYLDPSAMDVFFVPLEAVNIGQRKTVVFVVKDGLAVAKEIITGEVIGTQIEVLEGLSVGEVLVIENSRNLQDGQPIRVTDAVVE